MTLPAVVTTERLRLGVLDPDEAADIVAGRRRPGWHPDFPRKDDRDAITMYRPGDPWGPRTIIRGATVLGSIGFFGPPEPPPAPPSEGPPGNEPEDATGTTGGAGVPEAEVGYGLVEEARGWGFATEALRALLAETDRAGVRVRASVEPDNGSSIRVLAKCGFTELRGSDEDGNLVMARPLPAGSGG